MSRRPFRPTHGLLKRLRCSRGAVAIEYAAVLLPTLAFFFGSFEVAMKTLSETVLLGALQNAARQIRTGEIQTAADYTQFRQMLCSGGAGLIDCDKIVLDVRTFAEFTDIAWPPPEYDEEGNITNYGFAPGGAKAITTIKVLYTYEYMTPGLAIFTHGGSREMPIEHTLVMKTEPFAS